MSLIVLLALALSTCLLTADELPVDDSPKRPGEWGFRPSDGESSAVTPPSFVWRPQEEAIRYELQVSPTKSFGTIEHRADGIEFNCYTPDRALPPGRWYWRFRYVDRDGRKSSWSRPREFRIPEGARRMPMPPRKELLSRIPRGHPRLFIRPEDVPRLRRLASTKMKESYAARLATCDRLLEHPPDTTEPPLYPPGMKRGSEPWRKIWWGNRRHTTGVLGSAATLGFTWLISEKEAYGQLARRLLLSAAEWDPKGSTGYRYNDEAGMPYAYYFSRTYSFINDLLTEEEKDKCRRVMQIRGAEMYRHLYPRHLWWPYASHSNRAWHFLGEVGIAFLDEIPEAEDWVWFATNVFYSVYPVWCDDDGGWHEGLAYWRSYIQRFTWWADIMRAAMGVYAYDKPYFSQIGYYPLYLQPPGTRGGGFGDLTARLDSAGNVGLMRIFAAQANNPYWQWYADAHGPTHPPTDHVGFIRGRMPTPDAKPPTDLPTSRCFRGIGQAMLNTNLLNAENNVEIIFKSSPFGSQSHGYEAQNAFLLYAFGERLLIRTGRRDSYGSEHHRHWMWSTRSVNTITVNGEGQETHSNQPQGQITGFYTSDRFDYVAGEAAPAYAGRLNQFTRHILFFKPDLILICDALSAPAPSSFAWWLHSPTEMQISDQQHIRIVSGKAACLVSFSAPESLRLRLTDQFDPPPRPRIRLVEWHLTAIPRQRARNQWFITLIRPHRVGEDVPDEATLTRLPSGFVLRANVDDGHCTVLFRTASGELESEGITALGTIAAARFRADGKPVFAWDSAESSRP